MTEKNQNIIQNSDADYRPLISIITVVYNGIKTIEQTILSVIRQPYQNKEYIIIDGGSTDGTIDMIKKYQSHLAYWVSEPDNGIYDAMNKGIEHAQGELIGILNSNDWFEENIFNTIADQFQKTGNNCVIHGILRNFLEEEFYNITGNSIRRLRYDMIQHPTCFIPRKIYDTFGAYDTKYKYSADYDLILRFVNKKVSFSFIEKVITNFRLGGVSSIPEAEKEMYRVRANHHLISNTEGFLRIFLVQINSLAKNILK